MRGDIFDNVRSHFSEGEREDGTWSADGGPPKAAAVIGEFGLNLAAALAFYIPGLRVAVGRGHSRALSVASPHSLIRRVFGRGVAPRLGRVSSTTNR